MEIDKYEALLEKAKDFNNLRNGSIWRIVEELVEAVEDLLEENSFLSAGSSTLSYLIKRAKVEGMREAATILMERGFVIYDPIIDRAEEIEKELNNEQ